MAKADSIPGLKEILGSLIFGANRPLSIREIKKCLQEVGEENNDAAVYASVNNKQIKETIEEVGRDIKKAHIGFTLEEVAGGFRLQSDVSCGRWLKHLLKTKPSRLSRPALETLSIVGYRQPISKADIEAIRGVDVGHMVKSLMEMQLVKIVGRSELPGRPFLYGTTHAFLDHFGLKNLADLTKMAPTVLLRRQKVEEPVEEQVTEDVKTPDTADKTEEENNQITEANE